MLSRARLLDPGRTEALPGAAVPPPLPAASPTLPWEWVLAKGSNSASPLAFFLARFRQSTQGLQLP